MLQEYIPGGPGHDWFFHGYCDADSVCRPAFTGRKERSYPAGAGLTCLGCSAANEELRVQITKLLARLGYRGLLDLDIRLTRSIGEPKRRSGVNEKRRMSQPDAIRSTPGRGRVTQWRPR